jgi:hypothetical protein
LQEKINEFSSGFQQQHLNEFQQLLHEYEHKKLQARNIFQPSNATYNTFIPPPSTLDDRMPRKICGDWSSKLKLLRYKSNSNSLGIRFTSDYSHHFSGFKAKIALEKGWYGFYFFVSQWKAKVYFINFLGFLRKQFLNIKQKKLI